MDSKKVERICDLSAILALSEASESLAVCSDMFLSMYPSCGYMAKGHSERTGLRARKNCLRSVVK